MLSVGYRTVECLRLSSSLILRMACSLSMSSVFLGSWCIFWFVTYFCLRWLTSLGEREKFLSLFVIVGFKAFRLERFLTCVGLRHISPCLFYAVRDITELHERLTLREKGMWRSSLHKGHMILRAARKSTWNKKLPNNLDRQFRDDRFRIMTRTFVNLVRLAHAQPEDLVYNIRSAKQVACW